MQFKNFTLDPFQEEAIHAIEQNYSVVVSAPTGSGKTLTADYIIDKYSKTNKRIIYTAPIKALSNQKYKDFAKEYGDDHVGLMTGDVVINPTAKVVIMTTEIYRNMAISKDKDLDNISYVIFDEVHYINDIERGYVWEESIIYSVPSVRFLCLSATIPNAKQFANWIEAIKQHPVKTVISNKRNVPLEHQFYDYELGITTLEKIKEARNVPQYRDVIHKKGAKRERVPEPNHIDLVRDLGKSKLPCLFFSFSRKDCQIKAQELAKRNLFDKDPRITEFFRQKIENAPPDVNKLASTLLIKETIPQGIAFHHAGLLPIIKEAVEELFSRGWINVLYTTETFAVGINMPAKTVCFNSLRKYDGINFRYLNTKEYFQIAGRAGRRGIDKIGYAISLIFRPTFDYHEVKRITEKDSDPIKSQFRLCVNTVLNLIEHHPVEEIEHILRLSFASYQKFGNAYDTVPTSLLLARYNSIYKKLEKLAYVEKGALTHKGHFAARIFADEITLGEIFATPVADEFDEYEILLVLASIVYEPREMNQFSKQFLDEKYNHAHKVLMKEEYLHHEKKFYSMKEMTTLIYPLYNGKSFFEILKLTNLLEGDLIRFYTQILDRLNQIRKATTNFRLLNKIKNCEGVIQKGLEGIYLLD
ncbi:DEAD/DEAH box helicase [Candidatus Woesearchaeota archaeon]|nr:DEAD/DEAH box helicase [Candidatus Woesearchaeota archaeon]